MTDIDVRRDRRVVGRVAPYARTDDTISIVLGVVTGLPSRQGPTRFPLEY